MGFQRTIISLSVTVLITGCTSAQKELPESADSTSTNATATTAAESPQSVPPLTAGSYQTVAKSRYGDGVEFVFNSSRNHVICIAGKGRSQTPFPGISSRLRFFIYDLTSDAVIFEESLDNARVAWEKDTLVKVSITPGIVQTEDSIEYGYLYDVDRRQKLPLRR